MGDLVEHSLRPDRRQVVVNALAFGVIPFKETHEGTSAAKVRGEFGPGNANGVFRDCVRVVGDQDLAALPVDPVYVRDDALHVEPTAVRPDRLADRPAPVVHAGKPKWEKPGRRRTIVGQTPKGQCLELTLGDDDRDAHIAQKPRGDARHDIQHVRSAGRAEVLLPRPEVAGGVVFKLRVVPAQPVLAKLIGARMEVWDDDPGVVAAFAADDLASGKGIDSPESGLDRQPAVDPTRFQVREVLAGQIRSDDPGGLPY